MGPMGLPALRAAPRQAGWRLEWTLSSALVCAFVLRSGASEEKKEGWSWASYLEEQKAVAAPLDLFQDVSWDFPVFSPLSSYLFFPFFFSFIFFSLFFPTPPPSPFFLASLFCGTLSDKQAPIFTWR